MKQAAIELAADLPAGQTLGWIGSTTISKRASSRGWKGPVMRSSEVAHALTLPMMKVVGVP